MENEQKKIAAYIYDLEPAEGNAQQEIPLTLLVKRILETATYHAENWGVGYSTLIKENRAWVLARLAIEMSSYPGIYDKEKHGSKVTINIFLREIFVSAVPMENYTDMPVLSGQL